MYLLPTFQNPMGVSMSVDRRRRLLEIAREHDLLLIEDDPYGDFWFDEGGGAIPPIRSLPGAEERVVYLGTFSKILAPGFRLAYAVAPPDMIEVLLRAKRGRRLSYRYAAAAGGRPPVARRRLRLRGAHRRRASALQGAPRRDARLARNDLRGRIDLDAARRWLLPVDGPAGRAVWRSASLRAAQAEGVAILPGHDLLSE